jgi:putative DNA primase/helicase
MDNREELEGSEVEFKSTGNNRRDDNIEPLITIAGIIGGNWPEQAWTSIIKIIEQDEESSLVINLLMDLREILIQKRNERIDQFFTAELADFLNEDEDGSWCTMNRGNGVKPQWIGWKLGEFGIKSKNIRKDKKQRKGYDRKDLEELFKRYLPTKETANETVPPSQSNDIYNLDENKTVPKSENGTDTKSRNHLKSRQRDDGTVKNTDISEKERNEYRDGAEF